MTVYLIYSTRLPATLVEAHDAYEAIDQACIKSGYDNYIDYCTRYNLADTDIVIEALKPTSN